MRVKKNGYEYSRGIDMNKSKERVCVIIPVYNSEDTIVDVLEAICNQTVVERIRKIIIVNDGSTDNSEMVIKRYIELSNVDIEIHTQKNKGVSSARNYGMSLVPVDDWIAFCDSDDLWFADKLQRQLEILEDNKTIDFLGAAMDSAMLRIGLKKVTKLYKASVKDVCIKNFPQPSTAIFKAEIYQNIGGFDEEQRYAEDGNYFLKICAKYNYYYLPEQLIEYGYGKRGFGVSGLSANLKEMYSGNKKNIKEVYKAGYISLMFYFRMRLFYYAKYIRRILITKFFS